MPRFNYRFTLHVDFATREPLHVERTFAATAGGVMDEVSFEEMLGGVDVPADEHAGQVTTMRFEIVRGAQLEDEPAEPRKRPRMRNKT